MRNTSVAVALMLLLLTAQHALAQGFLEQLEGVLDAEESARTSSPKKTPGYLGLIAVEESATVYVESVKVGSAAQRFGVRAGDIVRRIEGREVKSLDKMGEALNGLASGERIVLSIERDGEYVELPVVLGVRGVSAKVAEERPSGKPALPLATDPPLDSLDALHELERLIDADAPTVEEVRPTEGTGERREELIEALEAELRAMRRRMSELQRAIDDLSASPK